MSWNTSLPVLNHPAIYMGDFNSHHNLWGYTEDDRNGEFIIDWALNNDIHLMFDAKDLPTFHSARWNRGYNPDLCFVSTDDNGNALPASRSIYHHFPNSQHRPVFLEVGIQIPKINSAPVPRWNFRKADWVNYAKNVDMNIRWIPPTVNNFDRFVGTIISACKKCIPRGFRKSYISTWNAECDRLWNLYQENHSSEIGTELLRTLNQARTSRWIEIVENMNFSHSSKKAWDILKKLGGSSNSTAPTSSVHPNAVASQLLLNSKFPISQERNKKIKKQLRRKLFKIRNSPFANEVTIDEITVAITYLKPGKASGIDGLFPEFYIHLSKNAKLWLTRFFNHCYESGCIPSLWKKSEIRAILKPGKPKDRADSYRPISLLCVGYKLLERIIYNRIHHIIDKIIPIEQAGFRQGRNCCDQVLALSTFIEAGFENKKKTAVIFVDLSSAYDTVWKTGLMLKLCKIIKCRKTLNLISALLSNRQFRVHLGNMISNYKNLNNGLPQGSVLAPILFNVYTSDIPHTRSRKFIYADDLIIAIQYSYDKNSEDEVVSILSSEITILNDYFSSWRLKMNLNKTEVSTFHLSNHTANNIINVRLGDKILHYNPTPKYLGIILDRSLTFKHHCLNLRQKLKSRNNIIQKLTGVSWGASASVLRISALSLVYSTAEYCSSVWSHSCHVHHIDVQLNCTMRLISGTLKSTPLPWLHVISNIVPPHIRRDNALVREVVKIKNNLALPIHLDINNRPDDRLVSRCTLWTKITNLGNINNFSMYGRWQEYFDSLVNLPNRHLISEPQRKLEGFNLPRRQWCTLNRLRTNHGKTGSRLHLWDPSFQPNCDCGEPIQTMQHIINDCPRRKFDGGILDIHILTPEARRWLNSFDLCI